jgi:hypothetical protein
MKNKIVLGMLLLVIGWGINTSVLAFSQPTFSQKTAPTVTIITPSDNSSFSIGANGVANVPIAVTTTDFVIGTFDNGDGHWHLIVDGVDTGPHYTPSAIYPLPVGNHFLTVALQSPDHSPLGITDSVTILVTHAPTSVTLGEFGSSAHSMDLVVIIFALLIILYWQKSRRA